MRLETFREQSESQRAESEEKIAYLELTVSQLHSELQSSMNEESLQDCRKQLSLEKQLNKQLEGEKITINLTNEKIHKEMSMEIQKLQDEMNLLRKDIEQQKAVIIEKEKNLKITSSQLSSTKELLDETVQDLRAKNISLETVGKGATDLKRLLDQKEIKLKHTKEKLKKPRSHAEAKKHELDNTKTDIEKIQELQNVVEKMRAKLTEKDHFINALQHQIEYLVQSVGTERKTVTVLQTENSKLLDELKILPLGTHHLAYRWGYPVKLLVQRDDKSAKPDDGARTHHRWGMEPHTANKT
ncbi:Hypothetical predicted protein [Pelobates cultripes]|uniref:Uncharacterized protein n=1 Tax=Pelobates cultripes TaxID=61616 RepID=A0AAD1SIZ8_PELCU|nr:Hypothetical predicted protein [Pelobates cultripes]